MRISQHKQGQGKKEQEDNKEEWMAVRSSSSRGQATPLNNLALNLLDGLNFGSPF